LAAHHGDVLAVGLEPAPRADGGHAVGRGTGVVELRRDGDLALLVEEAEPAALDEAGQAIGEGVGAVVDDVGADDDPPGGVDVRPAVVIDNGAQRGRGRLAPRCPRRKS